jgi:hypothetical protein
MIDKKDRIEEEIKELFKQYEIYHYQRVGLRRLMILEEDQNAPICVLCRHCEQTGFLFYCTIFDNVGNWGLVYYHRKGKRRTYKGVPMKPEDCPVYSPMTPLKIR